MSMIITKENYPDIWDGNLADQADNKTNIANKRLYLAIRRLLREHFGIDSKPSNTEPQNFPQDFGVNKSKAKDPAGGPDIDVEVVTKEKVRFAAIHGQLVQAGYDDPSMGRMERWTQQIVASHGNTRSREEIEAEFANLFPAGSIRLISPDDQALPHWEPGDGAQVAVNAEPHPVPERWRKGDRHSFRVLIVPEFIAQFTKAVQRFHANQDLYEQVFLGLRRHGRGKRNNGHVTTETTLRTPQLAQVAESLIAEGVSADDAHIDMLVFNAISRVLGAGGGAHSGVPSGHFSGFAVSLPDLDAGTHVEIIPDNLNAVRVIYYAAQLEEMKFFSCLETVVDHATEGMLPISRGRALDRIYSWIKRTPERINEIERRGLYARVLGLAQGAVNEPLPNREFSNLWIRFLSTVSQKYREIRSYERDLVSDEQVHKAGRDLAVNLSLHGYGIVHPAAIELQSLIREVLELLSEPAVLAAYGVRDVWQLCDRVPGLYQGGAANGVKRRTMATSGEKVIGWLALKAPVLSSASAIGLRIVEYLPNGRTVPTAEFKRLAELCERWLAVTGTPDAVAEQNTDPVDLQAQPTVPLLGSGALPQSVRDAVEQAGGALPALPTIPQA